MSKIMKFRRGLAVLLALVASSTCWDDFFHPPSSESPLGGGLRLPKLPHASKQHDITKFVDDAKVWSREKVALGRSSSPNPQRDSTVVEITKPTMTAGTGSFGKLASAMQSMGFATLVGLALRRYLIWRKDNLIKQIATDDEEKYPQDSTENKTSGVTRWPWRESTRQTMNKMQRDQEECWRVLHTIYKKHASLEDSVKALQEKQSIDSNTVLKEAEQLSKHMDALDVQMKDLVSFDTKSIAADIAEIRATLSSCATKGELEAMAKLLKTFVENLKDALM